MCRFSVSLLSQHKDQANKVAVAQDPVNHLSNFYYYDSTTQHPELSFLTVKISVNLSLNHGDQESVSYPKILFYSEERFMRI